MSILMYSPPGGGWPQEIPSYYRGPSGDVRTDLQSLSHQELISLGWSGPHQPPVARIIENVEYVEGNYNSETNQFVSDNNPTQITSGWISKSLSGILTTATFNPDDNTLDFKNLILDTGSLYFITTFTDSIENWDYNPEIERWDWDNNNRQYVIINLEDEFRPVPPIEPPAPEQPPNWEMFESIILQSKEVKNFITFAASKNPLITSTFPASFFEARHGNYNSFNLTWNELIKISPLELNTLESILGVASACNLPKEFINIIKITLDNLIDGSLVTAKYPDWDTFESIVLQSNEMKNFIARASSINPLIAASFPAAFFEVKNNRYNSFKIIWNELIKIIEIDPVILGSIVQVAKSANLPEEFIQILE
jgi:hypothetical protein